MEELGSYSEDTVSTLDINKSNHYIFKHSNWTSFYFENDQIYTS